MLDDASDHYNQLISLKGTEMLTGKSETVVGGASLGLLFSFFLLGGIFAWPSEKLLGGAAVTMSLVSIATFIFSFWFVKEKKVLTLSFCVPTIVYAILVAVFRSGLLWAGFFFA